MPRHVLGNSGSLPVRLCSHKQYVVPYPVCSYSSCMAESAGGVHRLFQAGPGALCFADLYQVVSFHAF